jgi:uncharacterized protein
MDDPVASHFFRAAARGSLEFQLCSKCGYLRWPPTLQCPECLTFGGDWTPVPHDGAVWSFAVYDRAFNEAFRQDVPYVVALVELSAGPRLISNVVEIPPEDVSIGMRVTAVFVPFAADGALVKFKPAT